MSSKKYCVQCGTYLGDYMTDDFYRFIRLKYCPECKTEILRKQKSKCERERRKKQRLERQEEKTQLELLKEENELLRLRIQKLREDADRPGVPVIQVKKKSLQK